MSNEPTFLSTGSATATENYEAGAEPLTGQFIEPAFSLVGGVQPGMRVLDVAAGSGALSLAAAKAGANVLATDLTPAMVARCKERLRPYPDCRAEVMDGQALALPDSDFDAVFSMFGIVNAPRWRDGLGELARVTRRGGYGCVSTWCDPRTVGAVPFLVEAWGETFGDASLFDPSETVRRLSSPDALRAEMAAAGFHDVEVRLVEAMWTSPSPADFLAEPDLSYGFMPPYAALSRIDRNRLQPGLQRAVGRWGARQPLVTRTQGLVAAGLRK